MRFPDADETKRLRIESQEARLRLIETELSVVMTWCSLAQTEANLGEKIQLQKSLDRINRAVLSLRQHINDSAHVPTESAPQFRARLKELELKVGELEGHQQV